MLGRLLVLGYLVLQSISRICLTALQDQQLLLEDISQIKYPAADEFWCLVKRFHVRMIHHDGWEPKRVVTLTRARARGPLTTVFVGAVVGRRVGIYKKIPVLIRDVVVLRIVPRLRPPIWVGNMTQVAPMTPALVLQSRTLYVLTS